MGRLRSILALALVGFSLAAPVAASANAVPKARADSGLDHSAHRIHAAYMIPARGLPIEGHGFGNGIGLSQWGADGAATVDHLSAAQILDFYYPTTVTRRLPTDRIVRVELAASSDDQAWSAVMQRRGLAVTSEGTTTRLPASVGKHQVDQWRLLRNASALVLQYRSGSTWRRWSKPAIGDSAEFADAADKLVVDTSTEVTGTYPGSLVMTVADGELFSVNDLDIESYVNAVVSREMPPSWPAAALQAQAVAARSYATYYMRHPRSSLWDLYGFADDQSYGPISGNNSAAVSAVSATAGQTRFASHGGVIFAAYGAADGGETVASDVAGRPVSYLPAQHDPYDDLVPNSASAWTATLTRSTLDSAFPSVGSVSSVVIDDRDGLGQWGGRITKVTIRGSSGSDQVSGADFAFATGLRGPWWNPALPPGPVTDAIASTSSNGRALSVSWSPPAAKPGHVAPTRYAVSVVPGAAVKHTRADHLRITGLPAASAYAVTVTPRSSHGSGRATTVSSALHLIDGSPTDVALASSHWASRGAISVVLIEKSDLFGSADSVAAPELAREVGGPVMAVGPSGLGHAVHEEMSRILPAGSTVWLVGNGFGSGLGKRIASDGWTARPIAGSSAVATTVDVAKQVLSMRKGNQSICVIEADGDSATDASISSPATIAGDAAAESSSDCLVLLTTADTMPADTARFISNHHIPASARWTIGGAAHQADPKAQVVKGRTSAQLSVATANAFVSKPSKAVVVADGDIDAALAGAVNGPVLVTAQAALSRAVRAWVTAEHAQLKTLDLAGSPSELPYLPVAAALDAALLGH